MTFRERRGDISAVSGRGSGAYVWDMHFPSRRFIALAFVVLLIGGLAPVAMLAADASIAATTEATAASTADQKAFDLINDQRTSRGLTKLRLDTRILTLANDRAVYMAENDLLSHTHAGGKAVWDLMTDRGIVWYGAGEIIAYNSTTNLTSSAAGAVSQWLHSAPHKAIMLSTAYDYMAFGVAVSSKTGRRYWAGVFLKGPDRTGAWSKILSVSKHPISATKSHVTLRWDGDDTKLQVLTAGFKLFDIQRREDGGAWFDYGTRTTRSTTRTWTRGHVWEFRVRAQDKVGNWGSWKYVTVRP
jgi:uncharacterized protein YkwD